MAGWEDGHWESSLNSGTPRSQRRSGTYRRSVPDLLDGLAVAVAGPTSRSAARTERSALSLNGPGAEGLAGIARFLLRSEAIASSRIEGIAPSAQQVAFAELGQSEEVRGISDQAQLVANNMTVVREATAELVSVDALTVDHIVELHRSLLPDQPQHHGLRTVQNWIGTSSWSPIGAAFVPPGPERVHQLMDDLVDYLNGAAHAPLVQAALVHAQFETIHPFTDGNGRVGRALIHTVLARRGLADRAVLPISLVLATLRDTYVAGLTSYRHAGSPGSPDMRIGVGRWLEIFVDAAGVAVEQSRALVEQIEALRARWSSQLSESRIAAGLRPAPRADSAVNRLLQLLPEAPVLTMASVSRILDVSVPAAGAALAELVQADILRKRSIQRGTSAYIAGEVLDLITGSERRLASTQFDTRMSPPRPGTPPLPPSGDRRSGG